MKTSAARKLSADPAPSLAEVFQARCEARAGLVNEFYLDFHEAVDGLQAAAVKTGLVTELGQDWVQATMAAAFADLAEPTTDLANCSTVEQFKPAKTAANAEHAAGTTVEALMLSLRERGEAALLKPDCLRRLADLSTAQVRGVIGRLMGLRPRYPAAISDGLLLRLGEQLQ